MRKILLLSESLPYLPTSGIKRLLYNCCKILNTDLGLEVNWFVAEDDEQFVSYVCKILSNWVLRLNIGINGQRFVKENFTRENAKRVFQEVLIMDQRNENREYSYSVDTVYLVKAHATAGKAVE